MPAAHSYVTSLRWTGDRGSGTSGYREYDRAHEVRSGSKLLLGSSDPAFRGDPERWNPEEMLVASLSQCHLLSFLHRASLAGVIVTGYVDEATGTMAEDHDGGGRFTEIVLRPHVTVSDEAMATRVEDLHDEAHSRCFIASSVDFPVRREATVTVAVGG